MGILIKSRQNGWTVFSNAFQLIQESLNGGTITLKAYKDFTCELPIKVIIDKAEDELFVSVTILDHRSSRNFTHNESKSLTTIEIIEFIEKTANSLEGLALSFISFSRLTDALNKNINRL